MLFWAIGNFAVSDEVAPTGGGPESEKRNTDAMNVRRFVSIDELARITGLSTSTLRRRARDGSIPFYQPGGPRTRLLFDGDVLRQSAAGAAPTAIELDTAAPATQPGSISKQTRSRPKWRQTLIQLTSPIPSGTNAKEA